MIVDHIPFVQTNFILGLDCDEGREPFELTKRFLDLGKKSIKMLILTGPATDEFVGPARRKGFHTTHVILGPQHSGSAELP